MAATRPKVPVGSAQWFLGERQQANELVDQEVEEFTYSVRNEMEWLNEHMTEILNANQLNVADIFKTPGKLRGKTPRTIRKRNALQERAPLTDIFAPNSQPIRTSPPKTQFYKQVEQFQIAQDIDTHVPTSPPKQHVAVGKENTDSGYHGTTEDEMDVDPVPDAPPPVPKHVQLPQRQQAEQPKAASRAGTEEQDSFVSAKEILGSKNPSQENLREEDEATIPDEDVQKLSQEQAPEQLIAEVAKSPEHVQTEAEPAVTDSKAQDAVESRDVMDIDDVRSPSEGSSPVQPLLRKSSLTFASLPAREPLSSKHSIGNRVSRTSHLDQLKASGVGRSSQFGRTTAGKSLGTAHANTNSAFGDDDDHSDIENSRPALSRVESETTKLHNTMSTQRLHDRINMLAQTQEPRTSKSIQNLSSMAQSIHSNPSSSANEHSKPLEGPAVPLKDHVPTARVVHPDDDDDWIVPVVSNGHLVQRSEAQPTVSSDAVARNQDGADEAQFGLPLLHHRSADPLASPSRVGVFGHVKSISGSAMPSPTRAAMAVEPSHKKAVSVSNPDMPSRETTTPAGSPNKKYADGPLSASKAKLYSVLKSAKGIFASSAAVSAQAKSEVLSSKRSKEQLPMTIEELFSPNPEVHPTPALYPNIEAQAEDIARPASPSKSEGRRTRSSSEREKEEKRREREVKEKERMTGELEKAREKERQKAATQKAQKLKAVEKEPDSADEMPPPPPPKSLLPTTGQQPNKTREQPRRPMKPTKETLNKSTGPSKPVRVYLESQRIGQNQQPSNTALSASLHDSLPPQVPPKQPPQQVLGKTSTSSLQSQSSSNTLRTNASSQSGRPKALEAAARKKELEEKAAQRKAEQKRELEQKRAAKLEEERKAEQQRKEEEQRRIQEAKRAAQRKAEEAKRLEQQKREAARPPSRQANELANALQQERSHGPPTYQRADLGTARPVGQIKMVQDPPRAIPVNHAKPAKRPLQPEQDEEAVQRPTVQRNPPSYQQLDAKRRRTNEGEEEGENRRSVMAPPIRNSNIRKEPSKFTHGYVTAPQQSSHATSMFKATVTSQHQLQQQHGQPSVKLPTGHPHDMAKYANARIPFADGPNAPAAGSSAITANSQTYKTPLRPEGATIASKSAAKSSPHYPPGESIQLPDIATDSEDEDSDNEFAAPSWVDSPLLNQALSQQQLVDPETIFGPIGELKMDEIFKNKERAKRWRERTSSANWNGADRLTEEERRRDKEGREKMMKEGGWTFGTVPEH
ncbi:hypothetical protein NA57DRAFT_78278 [Rhizodiscina lignyota]|uniref:Inner centromere protein ARK-binding domain-containing protein n=1 Tax=Rhizodiscina lignyota TaxID=1504668 RepID=A0A9P4I7Y9_9PEZI|nr:hypothetical protein NA57DRAFT_78278 [Rhizodiscina lignyota]